MEKPVAQEEQDSEMDNEEAYQNVDLRVLNESDTFAIFDTFGHIIPSNEGIQGIYYAGTRYVSRLLTTINGKSFIKLSSAIREKNDLLTVDLTNPKIKRDDYLLEHGVVHMKRSTFVRNGSCYTKIIFFNFGNTQARFDFSFRIDADFRDIFEIRGMNRKARGKVFAQQTDPGQLRIHYEGLDQVERSLVVRCIPDADDWAEQLIHHVLLDPGETRQITYNMHFYLEDGDAAPYYASGYEEALSMLEGDISREQHLFSDLYTSNEQFTHLLNRSKTDLISLLAYTKHGLYPYAGVPWYNTAFGRDGIITAYETLWIAPEVTRNTLLFLAALQARTMDPRKDAEPGKIFHEMRKGEMANTGEVPFSLYYGTIDATPLFIMLAGEYYKRTADLDTCRKLWPSIELALKWMEQYGDPDGDGFLEYRNKADDGLTNQGWKDSHDAISYLNGQLARAPIALCEVQGYAYAAYKSAAVIARELGKNDLAGNLKKQASTLRARFNEAFWDKELQCYVLALDGNKEPCRVVSSNAGQCMFTGIATPERAAAMTRTLLGPTMYTGWGIRTLSSDAVRYNPMSYHNGSVWPHDVALIAEGLACYGHFEEALKLVTGLFDASLFLDLQRMPELFCGFNRRAGEGPTNYPVACSPQAWSVGAVFLLVKAMLRMEIDARKRRITFGQTHLPDYLNSIMVRNLQTSEGMIDLEISRQRHDVGVEVIKKPDSWSVIIEK